MVFQFKFWRWNRLETLIYLIGWMGLSFSALMIESVAYADHNTGLSYLKQASQYYYSGQYFKAARYAFAANEEDPELKPIAYAWITLGLAKGGFPNAATYFFIRTLQQGNRASIRSVLRQSQNLLMVVGPDLLRKYLVHYTQYEDYDPINRSAYLYSLAKDALLSEDYSRTISYINGIQENSPLWPFALQLRGSAYSIQGQNEQALDDFKRCIAIADRTVVRGATDLQRKQQEREADDLASRCQADQARTYYQMEKFHEADRAYDRIPKRSFVWPDILFEQAWNAFALDEFNRTLGKLVSYKSPALSFVFNSEADVLRAQAFLALCLYSDANDVANEFNAKYTQVGVEIKNFVESNAYNLPAFYNLGKSALETTLYTKNDFYRLVNRFIRGPYFQNLVSNERQVRQERESIHFLDATQQGVSHDMSQGFPGFLNLVLQWRIKTIRLLGGAFVKNSLLDYHATLLNDFDKMAYIKLEMLKRASDQLVYKKNTSEERSRGSVEPSRRDDQYRWNFNGEFWSDELGDYVFGLKSECKS